MAALRFASSTRIAAIQDVVDGDPVTARIRDIVAERTMWSGSASELLRVAAPIRETTHRRPGPVGQDLPKRLQAGSGPRAQRYPLRPFSIVSAYPPTEKLSIDGLRARSRPSLVLGEFSSAASELTVMTMLTMLTMLTIRKHKSFRSSGVRDLVQRLSFGHWNRRLRPEMGTLGVGS